MSGIDPTGGVTSAKGFRAAGVKAGVKYADRLDVALVASDRPCAAAGVFTTNQVFAAPVGFDRARLAKAPAAQCVAVNTGCANACTGEAGQEAAAAMARAAEEALGLPEGSALVASTGVIGAPLPVDRVTAGIAAAAQALAAGPEVNETAARAIMTTDTRPKHAAITCEIDGKTVTLGGMCKGAGMIEPKMATMLAFITTDAAVDPGWLQDALKAATDQSFNCVVVDGDESTNDSLFCLANGAAGNKPLCAAHPQAARFQEALTALCQALAKEIVMDGEGVSKFVTVRVTGAETPHDAHLVARAIARSPLVKTSWFGRDPNWGRVLCAAGYSGAEVDPTKTRIRYAGVCAYDCGQIADEATLAELSKRMEARAFDVDVELGLGDGAETVFTCDLTFEYVKINAEYTT